MSKEAMKLAQQWQQTNWNTENPMSADFAVSEANDVISALIDALREALAEQPAPVQQGWKLVPIDTPDSLARRLYQRHPYCRGTVPFAWEDAPESVRLEWLETASKQLAAPQPAQPQQEPVAYMVKAHGMLQRLSRRADVADELACQYRKDDPNAEVLPLYTSPPAQRKPLTDEMVLAAARMLSDRQAAACNVDCGDMWKMHGNDFIDDARAALEAAHGIKENT